MNRKNVALEPGDVVAVPRSGGGYHLVLLLASNRFGDAFGPFQGHVATLEIPSNWDPRPLRNHVYTGRRMISTGRWRKIARREDLLHKFSSLPEIYHSKADHAADPAIGPHGSAETADGRLRPISESEAVEVGLANGTYRQIMVEEQFEGFLEQSLG